MEISSWPCGRKSRSLAFGAVGKGEAPTALLEGPKPARGDPRLSLWHGRKTNRLCLIWRTAVYGPVCTVVWEGRSRKTPPYPDWERNGPSWEMDWGRHSNAPGGTAGAMT